MLDTVMAVAATAALVVLGKVAGRHMVPDPEAHHTAVEEGSWEEAAIVHMELEKAVGRRAPLEAAGRSRVAVADPEEAAADIDLAGPVEDIAAGKDPSSKPGLAVGPAEDMAVAGSRNGRAD